MRKKEILRILKKEYIIKKKLFTDYDFEICLERKSYFVKVLSISSNHQITINSNNIWDIKKGSVNASRFITTSQKLLRIQDFNKLDNKIIIFTSKPFKLLKAINESEVKDISNESVINHTFITSDMKELINYIK